MHTDNCLPCVLCFLSKDFYCSFKLHIGLLKAVLNMPQLFIHFDLVAVRMSYGIKKLESYNRQRQSSYSFGRMLRSQHAAVI